MLALTHLKLLRACIKDVCLVKQKMQKVGGELVEVTEQGGGRV